MSILGFGKPHGLSRAEWEQRFARRLAEAAALDCAMVEALVPAELEGWDSGEDDWKFTLPEDAADENLSCWSE